MKHRWMLVVAVALIVVGVLGAGAVRLAEQAGLPRFFSAIRDLPPRAVGERVYLYGLDREGRDIPRLAPMVSERLLSAGGGGCASCHGQNGRGGEVGMMMRAFVAPDITYDELAGEGYSDAGIALAIRDAVDDEGEDLNPIMPRWEIDDTDMDGLIAYLKELSAR